MSEAKTVSVGCKLPHGLHLDLKMKGGGDPVRVTLKGANAARIVGGYGITENVDGEFMRAWLAKNAKHPAVVNGQIFIHEDARAAESIAKERRDDASTRTGLEPIDPIKSGMLRGKDGELDKGAVVAYETLKAKNPERSRQQVE